MNDQTLLDPHSTLREFLAQSDFMRHGGVMTDLDGTAVHEENGRVYVSVPMETGLKRMHDLGRAVDHQLAALSAVGDSNVRQGVVPDSRRAGAGCIAARQPLRTHGASEVGRDRV